MTLGLGRRPGDGSQPLPGVSDVRAELGDQEGDRGAHRLVVGLAKVDGDPRRQRAVGQMRVLGQVAPQRGTREVQDDVVQRAVGGPRQTLHALELVLLGRESALAGDPLAEHRIGRTVGRLERARIHRRQREIETGAREPRRHGGALAHQAERRSERAVSVRRALADRPAPFGHGPEGRRARLRRVGRERAHDQAHAADAVDQRMVDLAVHRETVAFEPLDQVHLPERAVQVELVAVQPRDQDAELALAARVWQRRMAHVVIEIDVVDLAHDREPRTDEGRLDQLQVPGRRNRLGRAHPREQVLEVAGRSVVGLRELEQAAHVHRRVPRLDREPGRIHRRQATHLYSISLRPLGGSRAA